MSNYYNIEEHVPAEKDEIFFTPTAKTLDWFIPSLLFGVMALSILYACYIVKRGMMSPKLISSKLGPENDDQAQGRLFVKKPSK